LISRAVSPASCALVAIVRNASAAISMLDASSPIPR
jgi:hypothetical protein